MSKFQIIKKNRKILSILCLFVIIKLVQTGCPYPYERCICTGSNPYCPCSQLTATQAVNSSSTYNSHLILVNNYGCRTCPPRCKKCTGTQVCTDCFDEFQLVNNYCVQCPINCKKCKSGVCQSCIDGYYIDYQQKCQKCPLMGTKTCTIDSLLSCLSNYWMDNNGATCINCDVNCKACSSTTKCSTCIDGYFEMNYICYKCRDDCLTCTNASSCITCVSSGFYFNSSALGTCVQCPVDNCLSCNSNGTCTQCDSYNNYYLDKTTKQCSKYLNSTVVQNCKNLTYTVSTNLYSCQNCKDGYYSMSDYSNSSLLTCYYGCSIVCSKCTGPHYGLCDQCISDTDFTLLNRHCIPKFNLKDGSAFQLLYTALNNVSFFQAPNLILPDSCWHEHVKGGSSSLIFRLSKMSVYKFTLKWKLYKYNFINSNQTDGTYSLKINNTLIQDSNLSQVNQFISLNCMNKVGFSSLCVSGSSYQCTDKNSIDFDSLITATDNVFTFTSNNSLIAMSQLLIIGYRCGGVYGDGCIQCTDINTCTKCDNPSYYLIAEKCIAQCPNTYYTYEEFKKCVEICPSGSFSDDVLHQCFSCQSPCDTCTSITQCLTCRQGYFYDQLSSQCTVQCPKMYYKDSYRRICEKCSNPCLQCLDSIQCISCREGFLSVLNEIILSSTNLTIYYGQCVLQCPDGMYTDLLTMKCQQCLSPCKSCSMLQDQCTSCLTNYYLLDYDCLLECPQGYYKNETFLICSQCDSSCKDCMNLTYCAECQVGFYLNFDNTCVTSCSAGYYQEDVLKKCLQCKENCSTCNSFSVCTSCVANFSYLEDTYSCVVTCPKFYYPVITPSNNNQSNSSICQRCQLPCYQCSSEIFCVSCYDAFLYNGQCLLVCPSGYFANLAYLQCSLCDNSSCLQCKNTATQCTKCQQGLLLVNGKCLKQCPFGFYFSSYKSQCILCEGLCDTCLNSTYCLTCIEGFSLWKEGQCVNRCQAGYYQLQNATSGGFTCTLCPLQCQACIYNDTLQTVQCLLCSSGYSFYNGLCLINCPDGYFDNIGQCLECVSPCSKCKDQEYCLQCNNGYGYLYEGKFVFYIRYFYYQFEGTCVTTCPYGYYSFQNECLPCDQSCLLCAQSATNCLACKNSLQMHSYYLNNFTMSQSVCSSECPEGYFKDQSNSDYDNMCQKCLIDCKTCIGLANNCSSCYNGKILYDSKCVSQCPINTYFNQSSNSCILCTFNCLYCLDYLTCIQCKGQYYLTSNNTCTLQCSVNQYAQDGICKPCVYPCKSCINEDKCLSCLVGIYYVSENSCMDSCPQGSFYISSNNTEYCEQCRVNCSRCVSENECLFCDNGLLLYFGSCLQECPDGYYGNYGYCVRCDQNCILCVNSYTCLQCANGSYLFNKKCISYCPTGYFVSITILYSSISNSSTSLTPNNNTSPKYQSICQPCATQCTKCYRSSTQCTQCAQGYYLYINTCLLTCPTGSYSSSALQTCQPCVSPCQTCTNAYSCQTCIYGYLLYRQYSKNQCVQGPTCPNNYYLNTNLKICQFICPQNYYVSQSTKTCSFQCPINLVTFSSNMSCLQSCPQNMWIDQNLYCQDIESQPLNLPYLNCSEFTIRNLLFFSCQISNIVDNLESLKVENISLSVGKVSLLKIKSKYQFYILVTNVDKILRNQQINLQLLNRYQLKSSSAYNAVQSSSVSLKSTEQSPNISQKQTQSHFDQNSSQQIISTQSSTNSYPVQNYKVKIIIIEYIPYSVSQRSIGLSFYQIGQSISYAGLILWLFCLLKNVKIISLVLLINLQWLYSLSMLLSQNFLAPNIKQFLQGFKYSAFIDIINVWSTNESQTPLWTLSSFSKPQYWAINDLYSMQESLITVYVIIGFFLFIFLLTLTFSRILTQTWINPQYETIIKIGKKSQLINQRFYSNYFFHLLLIMVTSISLLANIQFTSANVQGLVQSIILFLSYLIFIIITVYFYVKWKTQNIKKNTQKSMLFFYLSFGTIIFNSIFIIWSTFYLFVGFSVASIVLNMIAWHIIFRQSQSKRCSYLQIIEVVKGFILIVLIIGDIKRQKWSQDEMFYFGFVQIIIVFLYVLLSAAFISQQLFRPQQSSVKKHEKPLQQSMLKQQSLKTSNYPKHYQSQKDHQDKSQQQKQSQQVIKEEQQQSELSFFSNKTPLSQSDDSSQGDIIDFDQSQQHNRQSSSNKNNLPPKNLFKYDKNS